MAAHSGAVGSWEDGSQNEKVLSIVRDYKRKGFPVSGALEQAAKELGRSESSVRNRWYSHLIHVFKSESVAPAQSEKQEGKYVSEAVGEAVSAPTDAPTNNTDGSSLKKETDEKYIAGEVVLQQAGIHVVHNEDEDIPAGTSPAVINRTELVDTPYIKVAVSPITKAQLDIMCESELYDLMMNVMIKIQELSSKKDKQVAQARRDLHLLDEEYKEVKVGYTSLLGVINTAREMAIKDSDKLNRPLFRMEANGNLEPVK